MPSALLTRRTLVAALPVLGAACRRAQVAGRDRPFVLVFGPLHAPKDAAALQEDLAARSGLKVELRVAASSNEAVDLIQAAKADGALLPLFDFLFCADVYGVVPLAQVLRAGDAGTHAGELVVRADAPLSKLEDLRGRRVGYVDRYSVTGFLLPAARLREAQVEVEAVWLGSHDAVLEAVANGAVAAGASYSGHAAGRAELRALASTGAIANEPVFVQAAVPADVRGALQKALLAEHDPKPLAGLADATGFRAPPPGTYQAVLQTVQAAGRSVEDVVVGGWARANEQRRPIWSYGP